METDLKEEHIEGTCQMDLLAKIDPLQRLSPSADTDVTHTGVLIDLDWTKRK